MDFDISKGQLIGEGAHGKIYRHTYQGKDVAVKVCPWRSRNNVHFSAISEIAMYKYLSHPGILPASRILINETNLYLVMPYIKDTLRDVYKTMNIEDIAFSLFDIFAYLSMKKVIHRDIHTRNILVKDGKLYLIDFGNAALVTEDRMYSTHYCLQYRPPEVFLDCNDYDTKADVWAVGILLYRLLTGTYIIEKEYDVCENYVDTLSRAYGYTQEELDRFCSKHELGKVLASSADSTVFSRYGEVGALVRRMLALNAEDRPTFEELVTDALFAGRRRYNIPEDERNLCLSGAAPSCDWSTYASLRLHGETSVPLSITRTVTRMFSNDFIQYNNILTTRQQFQNLLFKSRMKLIVAPVY